MACGSDQDSHSHREKQSMLIYTMYEKIVPGSYA